MLLKAAARIFTATLFIIFGLIVAPSPAHANTQKNYCACLVTESSPCTCTKNWTISPLATHRYVAQCDANGDGQPEPVALYSMSFKVRGRDKYTTCTGTIVTTQGSPCTFCGEETKQQRDCTNWSLTKKDSTSTVVTCTKLW